MIFQILKLTNIFIHFYAKVGTPAPLVGQSSAPTSSTFTPAMVVTPISEFNPTTGEFLHYVEDNSTSVSPLFFTPFLKLFFKFLNNQAFDEGSGKSPRPTTSKVVILRSSNAFGVTWIPIHWPKKTAAATSFAFGASSSISIKATFGEAGVMPHPLASIPVMASLLRSPRHPSEPQNLQDQCRIFKKWMKNDFTASFSLKELQEAEKALTELCKAQQMSKVQYESFISFFENLRALRD